jgi:hypothetical protein
MTSSEVLNLAEVLLLVRAAGCGGGLDFEMADFFRHDCLELVDLAPRRGGEFEHVNETAI